MPATTAAEARQKGFEDAVGAMTREAEGEMGEAGEKRRGGSIRGGLGGDWV